MGVHGADTGGVRDGIEQRIVASGGVVAAVQRRPAAPPSTAGYVPTDATWFLVGGPPVDCLESGHPPLPVGGRVFRQSDRGQGRDDGGAPPAVAAALDGDRAVRQAVQRCGRIGHRNPGRRLRSRGRLYGFHVAIFDM